MKNVTIQEIETWNSGIQKYLTLTFENGTVLTNSDIVSESMSYEQSICDSDQLEFGTVAAASFSVKLIATATADTLQGERFIATITCGEYTRQLGRFVVFSDEKSADRRFRTLECYDELYAVLNEDFSAWHNSLNLNQTSDIKGYRDAFFDHLEDLGYAVTQVTQTLPNDNVSIITYNSSTGLPVANFVADGYSGQDVLFAICQANGCFGIINTDGQFEYLFPMSIDQSQEVTLPQGKWGMQSEEQDLLIETGVEIFTQSGQTIIITPEGEAYAYPYVQGSLDFEEYYTETITMVSIRQSESDLGGQYGTEGATYSILGNPLFFNKTTAELNAIAQTLFPYITSITYMPFRLKTPATLWSELGDIIQMNSYFGSAQSILLSRTISGITALMEEYEADGVRSRSDKANNPQKSILAINQKTNELVRTVDENSLRISQVETTVYGEIEESMSSLTQTVDELSIEVSKKSSGFFFNCVPVDNNDMVVDEDGNVTYGGSVTITAHFFKGAEDVTEQYPSAWYEWYKKTEDGKSFISSGYSVTVDKDDYGYGGEVEAVFTIYVIGNIATSQGRLTFTYNGESANPVMLADLKGEVN